MLRRSVKILKTTTAATATAALVALAALFGVGLFGVGCAESGSDSIRRETEVFGTRAEIIVPVADEESERAGEAIGKVFAKLHESHRRFHPWREGETARINRAVASGNLPTTVSAEMSSMLSLSADGESKSGGVFNPAIGTLVSLWGFHSETPPAAPPKESALKQWLQNPPTLKTMRLKGNKLSHLHPRARLDFGGTAKGAALDDSRRILRGHGIQNALINIGGNIMALGRNGKRFWRVELRPSRDAESLGAVELRDGEAVSISGAGERSFTHEGIRYHHILDPRTAHPAKEIWSAGVVVPSGETSGALSDIAATALALAETDSAAERMLSAFGISLAFRISSDGRIWMTTEMRKRLSDSGATTT